MAERYVYLDIAPYNTIALSCTAMLTVFRVPVPGSMRFSWLRAVGASSPASLPAQTFTDDNVVGPTGVSMLNVSAEEAGSHTYSCVVIICYRQHHRNRDCSTRGDRSVWRLGLVGVIVDSVNHSAGPTSPSPPMDLMAACPLTLWWPSSMPLRCTQWCMGPQRAASPPLVIRYPGRTSHRQTLS